MNTRFVRRSSQRNSDRIWHYTGMGTPAPVSGSPDGELLLKALQYPDLSGEAG
jgi:hypothetical protein